MGCSSSVWALTIISPFVNACRRTVRGSSALCALKTSAGLFGFIYHCKIFTNLIGDSARSCTDGPLGSYTHNTHNVHTYTPCSSNELSRSTCARPYASLSMVPRKGSTTNDKVNTSKTGVAPTICRYHDPPRLYGRSRSGRELNTLVTTSSKKP